MSPLVFWGRRMIHNLKKDTKIYIVQSGFKFTLDVYPDFSFSQTFNETNVPVKTLHSQFDMFDEAVVVKANPANFSFTMPVLVEGDLDVVIGLLLEYDTTSIEATLKTADLYIQSNSEVYKLEKMVIESGVLQIEKASPILLNVSGTASKLSKFTGTIPGTAVARSSTRTYSTTSYLQVLMNTVPLTNINSISVELKNNVQWMDFDTIQKSSALNGVSETMFPETFVVQSRLLSGIISQYVTEENGTTVSTWARDKSLKITAGTLGASARLVVDIPKVVYTNRLDVQDIYTQSFDFRMLPNVNSGNLRNIIKKT